MHNDKEKTIDKYSSRMNSKSLSAIFLLALTFAACDRSGSESSDNKIVSYSITNVNDVSDGASFIEDCITRLYDGLYRNNDYNGLMQSGNANGTDNTDIAESLGLPSKEELIASLCESSSRATVTGNPISCFNYRIISYTYRTTDQNNTPINLSSVLAIPYNDWYTYELMSPEFINIDCHSTIIGNPESPTSQNPNSLLLAVNGALVVCPDYQGFGSSFDSDQLYLCNEVGARQVMDATIAAVKILKDEYGVELTDGYYTQVTGYGQGGAMAVAVSRAIETMSADEKDIFDFNLKQTFCGSVPFDIKSTALQYLYDFYAESPALIPLLIKGQMSGNADLFQNISYNDYFTPEYLMSGIDNAFSAPKQYSLDYVNSLIHDNFGYNCFEGILSQTLLDECDLYLAEQSVGRLLSPLLESLERNSLLKTGWTPENQIWLYHPQHDEVVPYLNCESASKQWSSCGNFHCTTNGSFNEIRHFAAGYAFYIALISGQYTDWF